MAELDRREFVILPAAAAALAAEPAFFNTEDARWIEALMARIVPADDTPGAVEAGCLNYLNRQLQSALARFAPDYRSGLAAFQKQHPTFLELSAPAQVTLLEQLGRNPFFEMLVDHTMQGFYGSPDHGGNRDEASWKMMGIERYMGGGHWHGA